MDLSDLKRQLSLSKRSDNPELNIYTSLEFQALGVEVEKMTEDIKKVWHISFDAEKTVG